jgi:hypothetical protein
MPVARQGVLGDFQALGGRDLFVRAGLTGEQAQPASAGRRQWSKNSAR